MAALPHVHEQAYSLIGHLARIFGGRDWKSVRLAMFTAYFDASGAKDQSVLAVAGFVASAEQWIDWEVEWLKRLGEAGLKRFHHNELNKWKPSEKRTLIDDLCGIIANHISRKAGVVVVNNSINVLPVALRRKWGINPYTVGCRNVAKQMSVWAESWGGRFPEMFFEKGDTGQEWLGRNFELTGYPRPNIRRKHDWVSLKTGIAEVGLVAFDSADLFAQQLFERERIFRRDGYVTDEFAHLQPVLDKIPGRVGTVGMDNLQFLTEGLDMEESDRLIMVPRLKINTK
jgi:hypothetical protein